MSDFVYQYRECLHCATLLATEAFSSSQAGMKMFDRKAVVRQFRPGDKVLVMLPTPGSALTALFSILCVVESKVTDRVLEHVIDVGSAKESQELSMLAQTSSRCLAWRTVLTALAPLSSSQNWT